MILTSITDINFEILSHVDDDVLENLSQSNTYYNALCHEPYLWQLKIINVYDFFPLNGYDYLLYKQLYYKLKYKEYTSIMLWLDHNNKSDIINWLICHKDYKKYVVQKINKLFKQLHIIRSIENKIIIADQIFISVYNHRYIIFSYLELTRAIKNKLIELHHDPFYVRKAQLYYKLIFNCECIY